MAYDTWKEKNADDREFAENRRALDEATADVPRVPLPEWKEQPYPPLRSGSKGTNTATHPGRAVHRERFT